ncbi:MAG: NUDIX hydrolase [Hyphomicrobiales bacterium]|nr:MAG: NUDIX hydrolase [Hyphomicrobiales bacterium]
MGPAYAWIWWRQDLTIDLTKGATRDQLEIAAARDGEGKGPNMAPKDAATLIILDGEGDKTKVLMGRRHEGHKFMPGLFVFPGGRVDAGDGSIPATTELEPVIADKIFNNLRAKPSRRRARALGLACLRETYEEAGLLLGEKTENVDLHSDHPDWMAFAEHKIMPTLDPLRLIARAITPPGRTRRFDAWFFATPVSHIAHRLPEGTGPSGELQELVWVGLDDALDLELPVITVTVLKELKTRLHEDPTLSPTTTIPFFHLKGSEFLRKMI